jgi:hypothetical protein
MGMRKTTTLTVEFLPSFPHILLWRTVPVY